MRGSSSSLSIKHECRLFEINLENVDMDNCNSSLELIRHLVGQLTMTSGEDVQAGIAGNYPVKLEDVSNEVIVFVLYYLEQKKCPHELAVFLAKRVVSEVTSSLREEENCGDATFSTAATLQMVVLGRLHKLCHHLINEPPAEQDILSNKPLRFASVFAIKNKRRKMEDRHVVIHDLSTLYNLKTDSRLSYYAVFDGHGGIDAASFSAAHLHVNMIRHPEFFSNTLQAIKDAYSITDEQFCKQASAEGLKCGCTAVSTLIMDDTLYLAWLGDSQALLIKDKQPVTLMDPHIPNRQDERERIEGLGGFVCYLGTWRVNGTLAVSRALGDKDFKPFVSSEPEVRCITLDGSEDFLILACDGLWDGMAPTDVSATLLEALPDISNDDMCKNVAKTLVCKSKDQGSDDNITVIVVFLKKTVPYSANALKDTLNESLISGFVETSDGELSPKSHASKENSVLHSEASHSLAKGLDLPVSVFRQECTVASSGDLPPEATILSELPTPPIDEVMNEDYLYAHKHEQMKDCLNTMENHAPNSSCSFAEPSDTSCSMSNDVPLCDSKEEALEIASNVISSVVETAIARVENMKVSHSNVNDDVPANISVVSELSANPKFVQDQVDISLDDKATDKMHLPECATENAVWNAESSAELKTEECIVHVSETTVEHMLEVTAGTMVEQISYQDLPECIKNTTSDGKSYNKLETEENPIISSETSMGHSLETTGEPMAEEKNDQNIFVCTQENDVSNIESLTEPKIEENISPDTVGHLLETPNGTSIENSLIQEVQVSPICENHVSIVSSDSKPNSLSDCLIFQDVDPLTENYTTDTSSSTAVNFTENLSSACEELPLASVAIDLTSVPVFVPEAEGVEDNDSDSEKDGGWSYVRASDNPAVEIAADTASPVTESVVTVPAKSTSKEKPNVQKPASNIRAPGSGVQVSAAKQTVGKTAVSKTKVSTKASVSLPRQTATKASIESVRKVPSKTDSPKPPSVELKAKKPVAKENVKQITSARNVPVAKTPKLGASSTLTPMYQRSSTHTTAAITSKPNPTIPLASKQRTLKPQPVKAVTSKAASKTPTNVSNNVREAKNTLTKPAPKNALSSSPKPTVNSPKSSPLLSKPKNATKPVGNNATAAAPKSCDGSKLLKPGLRKVTASEKMNQSNSVASTLKKREPGKTIPSLNKPLKMSPKPIASKPVNPKATENAKSPKPPQDVP